jgi:hypothetical protein
VLGLSGVGFLEIYLDPYTWCALLLAFIGVLVVAGKGLGSRAAVVGEIPVGSAIS